ncbi:FAD-dependent monooxygenase [Actinomycetospora endophytica]|uniref:FAD-dependent monooxygenase n=1 Tax=Actinomycetospora endophytica TaxID=2291215 RepID=A0ABS8P9W4_9PSEU|nr:FAD-dependent monooxygenase [Actinomycetospora endophytica]MCD2195060.1 FAD-dependent monooxygenase [Actinomycetospora endophytica]
MTLHRVAVLGGGPGGLYAARLLKLARPDCEVVVHEQGVPDQTFGFGVGLAARTQRKLSEADPATLHDILACSYSHDMRMRVAGREAGMDVSSLVAVGRAELLAVLQRHAEDAGVKLEFGVRRRAEDLDADLVIAADGVGSATRAAAPEAFGAEVETGSGWYLWAGTDVALDHALFAPAHTEHGTFVTHAYPYSPTRSTFLVETDEATWRAAGFDETTAATPADESDETALAYLSEAFAEHLGGHRLIGNRTRWLQFRTVRCEHWHHGNVVLLGDAAHTAHYSVGSGTKLAMEDAIALVDALGAHDDLEAALEAYTAVRRPAVARLQDIAERSRRWWETFPERVELPVEQLLVAYMSRAGNVPLDRFAGGSPEVVHAALTQWAGEEPSGDSLAEWVLARPLRPSAPGQEPLAEGDPLGSRGFDSRTVPDDPEALGAAVVDLGTDARPAGTEQHVDDAVRRAELAAATADVVWFDGGDDRGSVLTRFEVAELVRRRTDALVVVVGPADLRTDLADGLAADRTHLVAVREEQP